MSTTACSVDDVAAATRRIAHRIHRTPVVTSKSFDQASGLTVFFKCENQQRAGSFKIRGALNRMLLLGAEDRRRGVIASSAGNHAQAVALAAQIVGTTAVICMPRDAVALMLVATRGYGAEVVYRDRDTGDVEELARRIAAQTGRVLVPAVDDHMVIAGHATVAQEFLEDVPSLDAIVVPIGGGGLIAGCSTVAKVLFPGMTVYGVVQESAALLMSHGPGRPGTPSRTRTLVAGELPPEMVQPHVTDVLRVGDREIEEAVRFLLFRAKLLTEPLGAVAAAAVLSGKLPLDRGARVGVVLSGGNVDALTLAAIVRST